MLIVIVSGDITLKDNRLISQPCLRISSRVLSVLRLRFLSSVRNRDRKRASILMMPARLRYLHTVIKIMDHKLVADSLHAAVHGFQPIHGLRKCLRYDPSRTEHVQVSAAAQRTRRIGETISRASSTNGCCEAAPQPSMPWRCHALYCQSSSVPVQRGLAMNTYRSSTGEQLGTPQNS